MKRWLAENYEEKSIVLVEFVNLLTPMEVDVAMNFFGSLTTTFENIALIKEITEEYLEEAASQNIKVKGLKKSVKSLRKRLHIRSHKSEGSKVLWFGTMAMVVFLMVVTKL